MDQESETEDLTSMVPETTDEELHGSNNSSDNTSNGTADLKLDIQRPLSTLFDLDKHRKIKTGLRTPEARDSSNRLGEIIFKGHQSYEIMRMVQIGIRFNCGFDDPGEPNLSEKYFKEVVKTSFPKKGGQKIQTPSHEFSNFDFKDYQPQVFAQIRKTFGVDASDYMLSICGGDSLR
jgi:hypothetical protein